MDNQNEELHNQRIRQLKLERRRLRDQSNPFDLNEEYFRILYRMRPMLAMQLIHLLQDEIIGLRATQIPVHLQILTALRFFASGEYQTGLGQHYLHTVSQTSVSRIINRVANVIVRISSNYIKFPMTRDERVRISNRTTPCKLQIKRLLDFMEQHKDLANDSVDNFKDEALWSQLIQILNANGVKRNLKRWKKTWNDLKNNVKQKKDLLESNILSKPLSDFEMRVLRLTTSKSSLQVTPTAKASSSKGVIIGPLDLPTPKKRKILGDATNYDRSQDRSQLKYEDILPYCDGNKATGVKKLTAYESIVETEGDFKLIDLKKYFSTEIVQKYLLNREKDTTDNNGCPLLHVKDIDIMKIMEAQHASHRALMNTLSVGLEKLSDTVGAAMRDQSKMMRDTLSVIAVWDEIKQKLRENAMEEDESSWPVEYLIGSD